MHAGQSSEGSCNAEGKLQIGQDDLLSIFVTSTAEMPGMLFSSLLVDYIGRKRSGLCPCHAALSCPLLVDCSRCQRSDASLINVMQPCHILCNCHCQFKHLILCSLCGPWAVRLHTIRCLNWQCHAGLSCLWQPAVRVQWLSTKVCN